MYDNARAWSQFELFRPPKPKHRGGRPPAARSRVQHRARPDFPRRFPGLVTYKVVHGLPSLRDRRIVHALEQTLREACERGDFRLAQYSIQRDHVHLIVEAENKRAVGRGIQSIGARIARAVNRALGRRGRVLLERFHLRILRTPREVRTALSYVLNKLRKHLGSRAPRVGRVDPASSGAWFAGWRQGIVALARSPAPVAAARTWLLRVGWQRYGPLDPSEVPGRRRR